MFALIHKVRFGEPTMNSQQIVSLEMYVLAVPHEKKILN